MLTDPVATKVADVITSAGVVDNMVLVKDLDNQRIYRSTNESGTPTIRYVNELRIANYPNGSDTARRISVIYRTSRTQLDDPDKRFAPVQVTVTFLFDETDVTQADMTGVLRRMAHLLVNTTDGGILPRLENREL